MIARPSMKTLCLMLSCSALSACATALDKIDDVGKPPKFQAVANPKESPDYQPMSWPLPETQPAPRQYANSLWQPGARAFFRDQRAARVGDILRVNVKINDKAQVDNATDASRDNSETAGAPTVFGMQNKFFKFLPGEANPASLIDTNGTSNLKGKGTIKRKEQIETQVAALITQVLPNGNFVIEGHQEIRVNFELRAVSIKGVVRPQDITAENTIDSTQVAEARIDYGGRGNLTNVQQSRWGNQVIDALSPF